MPADDLTLMETVNAFLLLGIPAGVAIMIGLLLERMRKKTREEHGEDRW